MVVKILKFFALSYITANDIYQTEVKYFAAICFP